MSNLKFIGAISAALVAGIVLGGVGIAGAGTGPKTSVPNSAASALVTPTARTADPADWHVSSSGAQTSTSAPLSRGLRATDSQHRLTKAGTSSSSRHDSYRRTARYSSASRRGLGSTNRSGSWGCRNGHRSGSGSNSGDWNGSSSGGSGSSRSSSCGW